MRKLRPEISPGHSAIESSLGNRTQSSELRLWALPGTALISLFSLAYILNLEFEKALLGALSAGLQKEASGICFLAYSSQA